MNMNKYSKEIKLLVKSLDNLDLETDEGIELWNEIYDLLKERDIIKDKFAKNL